MAQNQAYLFLVFSLTGVVIGVLFDFFRILRRSIKTSNTITYIEDILFWILTGILILYSIWFFNNGEIRIFIFLGILLYIFTLSNIIVKIFSTIFSYIIRILIIPFKTTYSIISKIFIKFTKKLTAKKGKIVKNGE